jgi:hypothetical protein
MKRLTHTGIGQIAGIDFNGLLAFLDEKTMKFKQNLTYIQY